MTFIPQNRRPPVQRKYQEGDDVSIEDLRAALVTAAQAVRLDPRYLPLFQRIDRELKARDNETSALQRAMTIAENGLQNG